MFNLKEYSMCCTSKDYMVFRFDPKEDVSEEETKRMFNLNEK